MNFAHLHVHSDGSLLDGVATPRRLLEAAKRKGIAAIALTDHGSMAAHLEAQLESDQIENCPKILFGSEMYVVDNIATQDKSEKRRHIVLIAKDNEGYTNLITLNNISWRNFYYKPRIDFESIRKHRKGLICLTACAKGILGSYILEGNLTGALESAAHYHELFGDDFYMEMQLINIEHEGINRQEDVNKVVLYLHDINKYKYVVTNDCHYINATDYTLQSKVLHLSSDVGFVFETDDLWLRTYEDLEEARSKHFPHIISSKALIRGLKTTMEVAEKCNVRIEVGKQHIPTFDHTGHPEYKGEATKEEFFTNLCYAAMKRLGKKNPKFFNLQYQERMERELRAIFNMKATDYFLIVEDLIRYIRSKDKLVLIRGSANGSFICYCLKFGYIDPVEHKILFERFISPARSESHLFDVDIDIDMESEERPEAVDYLKQRYGEFRICNVGSYGRLQWRAAIKDMARVEALEIKYALENNPKLTIGEKRELEDRLGQVSFQQMNRITQLLEKGSKQEGGDISVEESLQKYPELQQWWETNSGWIKQYVTPVVGIRKAPSIHPASVVILPSHIDNWLPIRSQVNPRKKTERIICTQWEGSHTGREDLRAYGVMALDVLGVKTLSICAATFRDIKANHGVDVDFETISLQDKNTIKWFKRGETLGVFQLGAPTITQIVKDIAPDCFADVVNLTALDRPGALANKAHVQYANRKHNREQIKTLHKSITPIVQDTYGIPIYSEHIMLISMAFAGFSPVEAEKLRQLMKSKDRKVFSQFKKKFIDGAVKKHGPSVKVRALTVWKRILKFGAYSFPKAHASSYGLIAWVTMYLKANFPNEFFKNLLDYSDHDEYAEIRSVAKRFHKVQFVLPEINDSQAAFTIKNEKIVWALSGIKGIGTNALDEIVAKQPFVSFDDFYKRVNKRVMNKQRMESLIYAGCFRRFGKPLQLLKRLYELRIADKRKDKLDPKVEGYTKADWLRIKAEYLGFQTATFQEIYADRIKKYKAKLLPISEFARAEHSPISLFGMVDKVRVYDSKRGRLMSGVIYDMDGVVGWVVWNDKYEKLKEKVTVRNGNMCIITGDKRKNRDEWGLSVGVKGNVVVVG